MRRISGVPGLCTLSVLLAALAGPAAAQAVTLPFSLVDVADDNLAPDHCGIFFQYQDADASTSSDTGGVSVADYNNDGLLDVFLPNSQNRVNRLYQNLGGGLFSDVAPAKGVDEITASGSAALLLDYDKDGDLDIFAVQHLGKAPTPLGPAFRLWRNQGAGGGYAFSNVTSTAGFAFGPTPKLTMWGWVSGICADDVNNDGWTDLFVSWNSSTSSHDQWRLFRSDPNPVPGSPSDPNWTPRVFTDITPNSGIQGEFGGNPWQPQLWDVNRDGWADLHIAQDFTLDLMFINNKNGTFTNVATAVGLNGDPPEFRNEMGTVLGDYDNDLDLDLHTTNVDFKDRFYRNDSFKTSLAFVDIGVATGLYDSVFGWGTQFTDLDNDGDLDHVAVTGFEHDTTKAYINPVHMNLYPQTLQSSSDIAWQTVTSTLTEFSKFGTTNGDYARGLVAADYDGDGDNDLFVTRAIGRTGVYKNTLVSSNDWMQVDLIEANGSRDVTGARAYVSRNGRVQMRQLFTGSSFLCQEPPRLHFGLGQAVPTGTGSGLRGASGATPTAAAGATSPGTPLGGALGTGPAGAPNKGKGPTWLVVRWRDGAYQTVLKPAMNTVLTVTRSAINDAGDMDADGHLTAADQTMLLLASSDPAVFKATYPNSPGLIVGDITGDGVIDADDIAAWPLLPPH